MTTLKYLYICAAVLLSWRKISMGDAFTAPLRKIGSRGIGNIRSHTRNFVLAQGADVSADTTNRIDDGDDGDYENDDDDGDEAGGGGGGKTVVSVSPKNSRWNKLNDRIKDRIVKEGQDRAVANKKKREPSQDKKRRMMMYVKERQREKKDANRVKRPLPFDQRTPLSVLLPGMNVTGTVISLTAFGAYVDIGTECDGLLHVSQISNDFFVEHPKQVLSPGDEITVKVRTYDADRKKLHLTMLPDDVVEQQRSMRGAEQGDRIPLEDVYVDDELWGELRRVTDYGAYVEVGAVVEAWLHFMDHPAFGWSNGAHPGEYMKAGDRVRVWVSDVDRTQGRIKLTANRPSHVPGPRRAL